MSSYNKNLVFTAACIGMCFFGISMITLGSVLPSLTTKLGLDNLQATALVTFLPLGLLGGSLLFGPIVDRFGHKALLLLSCLVVLLGLRKAASAVNAKTGKTVTPEDAKKQTIAYGILKNHNTSGNMEKLQIKFDKLTSHDITFVGIIQTARASGLEKFPIPYVLTNCHNSLCAVGGTINEDDHMFGLTCAKKYGGIYVPPHQAVIHQFAREMLAGGGKDLDHLRSDLLQTCNSTFAHVSPNIWSSSLMVPPTAHRLL